MSFFHLIEHSSAGFEEFNCLLQELKDACGVRPDIILEATEHYHLPILDFLENQEHYPIIVNPLVAQRARKTQLGKVKTYAMDAYHLAEICSVRYLASVTRPRQRFCPRSEILNGLTILRR